MNQTHILIPFLPLTGAQFMFPDSDRRLGDVVLMGLRCGTTTVPAHLGDSEMGVGVFSVGVPLHYISTSVLYKVA